MKTKTMCNPVPSSKMIGSLRRGCAISHVSVHGTKFSSLLTFLSLRLHILPLSLSLSPSVCLPHTLFPSLGPPPPPPFVVPPSLGLPVPPPCSRCIAPHSDCVNVANGKRERVVQLLPRTPTRSHQLAHPRRYFVCCYYIYYGRYHSLHLSVNVGASAGIPQTGISHSFFFNSCVTFLLCNPGWCTNFIPKGVDWGPE